MDLAGGIIGAISYVIDYGVAMVHSRAIVPGTGSAATTDRAFLEATIDSVRAFLLIDNDDKR